MKRLILLGAVLGALVPGAAFAHEGGHQGGCEEFGRGARDVGKNPADYGFPDARNLGDVVSFLAHIPDGRGVGDVVETYDHVIGCLPG